jgi:hypothetical protein
VGDKLSSDYKILFTDSQKLHRLRKSLAKLIGILASYRRIASRCSKLDRSMKPFVDENPCCDIAKGLAIFMEELSLYNGAVAYLSKRASSTAELVSSRTFFQCYKKLRKYSYLTLQLSGILATRSEVILLERIQEMQGSLHALENLSFQAQVENKRLLGLADQGHKDSKIIKTLTQVATMYLPASLIAVRL